MNRSHLEIIQHSWSAGSLVHAAWRIPKNSSGAWLHAVFENEAIALWPGESHLSSSHLLDQKQIHNSSQFVFYSEIGHCLHFTKHLSIISDQTSQSTEWIKTPSAEPWSQLFCGENPHHRDRKCRFPPSETQHFHHGAWKRLGLLE